ncbi:MAG TPA: GAF domain-containing protein [Candidatus Limnocylindria bacterium]|nr:GAF domain-containing protein [Candidatus Limnocylindria bacterium]
MDLPNELEATRQELREALEQQTATSDILKVIATSPTDVQPVLDAIAQNAARVCGASDAHVYRVDGDVLRQAAHFGPIPGLEPDESLPLNRESVIGRCIVDRLAIHTRDAATDLDPTEYPISVQLQRRWGHRTALSMPLLRDGVAIGGIAIRRTEVRPFTPKQIELLQTFAAQAVIAIENVRLFNETKGSLERQTAISEILRVISRSPTEIQPVLDAIAENAARYCQAEDATVMLPDGPLLRAVAHFGPVPLRPSGRTSRGLPIDGTSLNGRAFMEGRVLHTPDILAEADQYPRGAAAMRAVGGRAGLTAPLLREGSAIGTISLRRREPRAFTEKQIDLLRTFADQAVIAIENVRLFNETKEALERQTAIASILRAISQSPTDVQPVLDAIAASAAKFCAAEDATIALVREARFYVAAHEGEISVSGVHEVPVDRRSVVGRSIVEQRTIQVQDLLAEQEEYPVGRELAQRLGHRTTLAAPLLREGVALGAVLLRRTEVRPFTEHQVDLVRAFADQAVIAIENVRLFNETKEALERQTATADVLRVISRSTFDLAPVLEALIETAARLSNARSGVIFGLEGDNYRSIAAYGLTAELRATQLDLVSSVATGTSIAARTARALGPVQVADALADPAASPKWLELTRAQGTRTILGVPLLRDGVAIGVLSLRRTEVKPFNDREIALVQSFADQAVIAIENVRLFNETKEALEQQTAIGEILRVISSSPTDIQPVLDTIAKSAALFCGAEDAGVGLVRGDELVLIAHHGPIAWSFTSFPVSSPSVTAHVLASGRTFHAPDMEALSDEEYGEGKAFAKEHGYRGFLAAPLLKDGRAIGVVQLRRREPGPFTTQQITLVETFASQAVIAIENVRLFNETKEALERQTATGEVLKVISRSAFDLQRVLDTVIESATKLTNGSVGTIWRLEGEEYRFAATSNPDEAARETLRRITVRPDQSEGVVARAARSGRPDQVEDVQTDPRYRSIPPDNVNIRTRLGVPLLREGVPIGVLVIGRQEVKLFTAKEIELVVSFADQAVIAIENTRLLNEIQDKSRQLEAASRHKSEFMANMSHELRTPLNAIIGFSDVLEQRLFGELNERQADYTRDIASSGRHLLDLVNEILDLSKVEAGRMELEPSEFGLAETIHGALAFVRERAASHRIALTADVPTDLGTVVADERKIRQVLLNLLSNAVKFTPDGGTIGVRAGRGDGEVQVAVRDTGIGIAPEDQPKVFDEFQQVGKPSDRSREGTGLGLTLAKRFIELHGGRMWVESAPGRGSTFSFAIPVGGPAPIAT